MAVSFAFLAGLAVGLHDIAVTGSESDPMLNDLIDCLLLLLLVITPALIASQVDLDARPYDRE
jgi:hypothetical protein